jgi:HPt (histidine-containing phosphotransfer) domain-containing protein
MDIRRFYELTGGDYDAAIQRFMAESRLEKFTRMFEQDPSYGELESSLAADNLKEAFRAAHTLKGVCLNLSFTGLSQSADAVTELLRHADADRPHCLEQVNLCMETLRGRYKEVIAAIRELDS